MASAKEKPQEHPLYIGCDHAGYELKEQIKKYLTEKGRKFLDLGAFSNDSVDYPDIAREVCEKVVDEPGSLGFLICGTGVGMMMTANRRKGIRAAYCFNEYMARMAREHNDANVLCVGSRVMGFELVKSVLDTFLNTPFSDDPRHSRRIAKIEENAKGNMAPPKVQGDADNDIAD